MAKKRDIETKRKNKDIFDIILRYVLAILCILILPVFYIIFKPLTIWPTYFILHFFYNLQVLGSSLIFSSATIEIIDACIAGSAFFLLLALNLITREIKLVKRIYLFIFQAACLLVLNILRLVIIIPLFLQQNPIFDLTHQAFWYVLSIVFVFLIWILGIKIFKIKSIPVYSDIKWLLRSKSK